MVTRSVVCACLCVEYVADESCKDGSTDGDA